MLYDSICCPGGNSKALECVWWALNRSVMEAIHSLGYKHMILCVMSVSMFVCVSGISFC